MEITGTMGNLFLAGFFVGLGWWLSKVIFVVIISKWVGKPIELSTQE